MFLDPVVNLLQNIVSKTTNIDDTKQVQSWNDLVDAYNRQEVITGYVDHKVRRGYMVRFGEVLGFSPRYRFDLCEYDDIPAHFINEPIPFVILSLDVENEHLVVSRIDAITGMYADFLRSLSKNQVIQAKVTAVMEKLVTVDVGGLTCLISCNEISWQPFSHPAELIHVGEQVRVKLLKVIPGKAYITASLKQLDDSFWQQFVEEFTIGSVVTVQISSVTEFGYFVTYNNRLSGILHWSELSWKPCSKRKLMTYGKGDMLEVKVSDLDYDKQRVSFSLKAMQPNPAEKVFSAYQVGDVVNGVIRSRTDFGLFVEIAENFNGLLHFSNLSWFTNSKGNLVNFRVGMVIRCKIIDIDRENERVGLGLKQLTANPFSITPSPQSLTKGEDFPRQVHIVISSFFQANSHNQVASLLNELKYKMRQHVDLQISNLFFDEEIQTHPDIIVVLLSDDFFSSEAHQSVVNYLANLQEPEPLMVPIVADVISNNITDPLLDLAALPVDAKPLQQWRVKSAYWSAINKALTKSVRYVAGLK
ncbi:MAG: hypothetical protein CSB47_08565 [Proteobacteria bacterium]|nr:MAG: hypothetical protein CSB47_08565 [Pseudomonadota bacterium]